MAHHWIAGSGMIGCLYDFGPEPCHTKASAIDVLWSIFSDSLSDRDARHMRAALRRDGIYYFRDRSEAGADYCEVSRVDEPMPEDFDS